MAPEQFDGAVNKRSDVYSLTCVFFEAITGARPYAGEGLPALMHQHLKIPPPRPSDRNPGAEIFDELVATGMAKNAAARFDSAGALARAARSALDAHRAIRTVAPAGAPSSPPPLAETPPYEEAAPASGDRQIAGHYAEATTASRATGHTGNEACLDDSSTAPSVGADDPTEDHKLPVIAHPGRTNEPMRRRLLPLGVVLTVLALIATTWAVAGRRGLDQDGAVAPGADATPAAAAPAAAPSAAVVPAPVGPTLTEAVFTGRSSGNELTVAVGVKDGRAAGYLCDGNTVEAWLEGDLVGDELTLHGRNAGTAVTASVDQRSLLGSLTVAGVVRPFSAQIATGPAGLFQSRRTIDGITTRIGWIVLPDGTQVGVRSSGTERRAAPPLDPITLLAVEDGRPIPVERLSGASTVIGS
jgi:hypothetical protein